MKQIIWPLVGAVVVLTLGFNYRPPLSDEQIAELEVAHEMECRHEAINIVSNWAITGLSYSSAGKNPPDDFILESMKSKRYLQRKCSNSPKTLDLISGMP